MKKSTKIIIAVAVLLVLAIGAFFIWKANAPVAQSGDKTITFTVIHADKSEKLFTISTDAEYLFDALKEGGVIPADSETMIVTFDGETAAWDVDESWWCLKDGEGADLLQMADQTPIADGESYSATYTIGFDY